MSLQPKPLAFVDTETTHLDPRHGDAWEIAVIRRDTDGTETEYLWQVDVPLGTADPKALEIGRYHERFIVSRYNTDAVQMNPDGTICIRLTLAEFLFDLQDALRDAMVVGSYPGFDIGHLTKLLYAHGRKLPWYRRPVDIVTLAVGHLYGQAYTLTKQQDDAGYYDNADALLADGWKSRELSALMGVEPPAEGVAHTALGDARWARDVYDAITKPNAFANRAHIATKDAA